MLSRRESFIKLRDCGSDQDIKLLAKETKSLGVMVNADDEMSLDFVRLFTDNFVNGNTDCCKFLDKIFNSQRDISFKELCDHLHMMESEHKNPLAQPVSDCSYMFRFFARSTHVMLVLDVSAYMYRYDYSTKCLSIQNLEDVIVLLFRLFLSRKEQPNCENRLYLSVYGYSLDCSELFVLRNVIQVIFEFQEINRQSVNELLCEVQSWLCRRYEVTQLNENNAAATRISDHIQQVLDRIRIGKVAHSMLILSNFNDMPDSPTIFFPSGWCTFGFVLVGEGNFGTEVIDQERVKEHYPSGQMFKMRHFFTARFIENCDKANAIANSTHKLIHFQNTTYKERNLLFIEKGELIEDILEKLFVFELLVEFKKPAERHGQYHKRDVVRQYTLPADKIVKVLKSRYMEGWQPFHSGILALNSKAYCFRLKIDRFTHLVYCAIQSDNKYIAKLSMQKHSNSLRYRRILEHSESNNVVVREIQQLQQIDMLLTSDFSSFKPKSHSISFGNLLDASCSELDILMRPRFRDFWSIFFHVERIYIGVFKIEAKTEQLFIANLLELIGKRLDFRVYYKQVGDDSGPLQRRFSKRIHKKGVLTFFIKHNRNCIELRMGFLNLKADEINLHLRALKSKIKSLDLGDAIIREVPEVLINQETHPGQVNRIQVEYHIKAGTELVYKWLEKHIIVWRLKNNFYYMDSGLYVKIKNLVDMEGNKQQFCIYYSIRKSSDFIAHVTVFSCPRFNQVRRATGGSISCKQLIQQYGQELKTKEQGLCKLLGTYLWIHRQLISHNDKRIIGRMLDKLSSVHSWTPTYSGFESELEATFEQTSKAYSHLPVTKDTLHALPTPEKFLIDSDAPAELGFNFNISGQNYQAILVTPLIPIILQVRDKKTYYRVIHLPQEQSQKEQELLDDALQLLQEDIRHKAYLQTYVDKFNRREGGDWMRNMRETSIEIGEFFVFWNTCIECEINCHYFQFRRSYISNVKLSFQRAFMELLGLLFDLNGDDFFEKPFTPRAFRQNQTAYISQKFIKLIPRTPNTFSKTILRPFITINGEKILVSNGDLVSGLDTSNVKTKYDSSTSVKLVLSYTTLEESGLPASVNFLIGPLQEIFKEFIIDFKRLDPKMLKEEQKCMGMVKSVLPLIDSLNNMRRSSYKFDLIQSKEASSQRNLSELMKTPTLTRLFTFCPVNEQFLFVHLLYLNSKNEQKGFLSFQNRIFEFSEFRKHIAYFFPLWFTLEIKEDVIETKLLIAPFNQTTEHNTKSLQLKIDRYVCHLFELANLNTLMAQLNLTGNCPSDPHELYINEATSKMLRQKATLKTTAKPSRKSIMEIKFAARKEPPPKLSIDEQKESPQIRQFRLPLLYKESIPLYERFQERQGLTNISQNQFWNSVAIGNLQDTYKVPFKDDTLIFHFMEVPIAKAQPEQLANIDMFKKCKNLLVYSVYCTNTELSKRDVDGQFRQNIIISQESSLVEKMSEFLMRSPDTINETELNMIMKGSKASIRIKLPYMSSYGIYLCYLRQALYHLHYRTSRRVSKEQQPRSESRNNSFTTRDPEFEYGDKQFSGEYEYKYNENDEMLFLFNFHRYVKSKAYFGQCVYLLEVFLSDSSARLDTLCESFLKEAPKSPNRKAKIFVYNIDPKDARHSHELEEITKRISPAYQRPPSIMLTPEPRRNSGRQSTTDDQIISKIAREHRRINLEFQINIFGEAAYDKIKSYLERTVEVTFEDYMIETVIGKLRKSIRDENENFSLRSRHKKSMDHDDMEPLHEENIDALTNLELCTSSTKTLTIMKCGSNGWEIEHCHLVELFHSVVREVTNILTGNSLDIPPGYFSRLHILYYFMNQDHKPVNFGNYWQTYRTKSGIESFDNLDDSDTLQGEMGIILSEHLIDELGEKNEESNKYFIPWTTKMKRFPDGKFFSNDCFNFKRHFLLKLSLNRKGIDLFTYNMDPSINYKLQQLLHSIELWSLERKTLKEYLLILKEKRSPSLSKRISSYIKRVSSIEVTDDFEDKASPTQPGKGMQLSITTLMKKLITEVVPPTDNGQLYIVNQQDMDMIYKIIDDEKIDFEELPEPKRDFKGILHKLGFQMMSIIRKRYLTRKNLKPEQEAEPSSAY